MSRTVVVVVVCYCTPTLGTSSAHSTLSRLVVHLEPKKESVWGEESHPSSSERTQAAAARRRRPWLMGIHPRATNKTPRRSRAGAGEG